MNILRRLIYRQIFISVSFVVLGFLGLFFFFDFLDQMRNVGKAPGYTIYYAVLAVLLELPMRLYELIPIAVLIGSIYVMARLAQSSEFTIMRVSGLTPRMALQMMVILGLGFSILTGAVGDYLAPASERWALQLQNKTLGIHKSAGYTGSWLKEREREKNSVVINIGGVNASGALKDINILQFNSQGVLIKQLRAAEGQVDTENEKWLLQNGIQKDFRLEADKVEISGFFELEWETKISGDMILAAAYKPDHMTMLDLWKFIRYLKENEQNSQKYEIEFWRKVFYPISCLVMVVLALPFGYLHSRSTGIATYVFIGVMIGISFFLLNNIFGYAGRLQNWSPLWSAAAPGILYTILSLLTFYWMVLRR